MNTSNDGHKPKYSPLRSQSRARASKPLSVLISVPCFPFGDVTGGLADWLIKVLAGGWPGLILKYDRVEHKWPAVRNQQLKRYLELSDCDYLMLIDSDIIPHPQVLEMVKNELDFCSAVCFSFQFNEPFAVVMSKAPKGKDGYVQNVPQGVPGVYERDAMGLACTVISRKLAETFKGTFRDKFDSDGMLLRDADFDFCERIKQQGYKVHVDTRFICGHKKGLDLKLVNDLLVKEKQAKVRSK